VGKRDVGCDVDQGRITAACLPQRPRQVVVAIENAGLREHGSRRVEAR
jgi:hypothetical protein